MTDLLSRQARLYLVFSQRTEFWAGTDSPGLIRNAVARRCNTRDEEAPVLKVHVERRGVHAGRVRGSGEARPSMSADSGHHRMPNEGRPGILVLDLHHQRRSLL